ncbi:MAG: DUF2256 domain-containing protein [Spirochaeta sp.]|nr:DUF2256 domain-containing protein [Spirochaeta sp.]
MNETKLCKTCGRPFANRKKWESRGLWNQIEYCSKRCQQNRNTITNKNT